MQFHRLSTILTLVFCWLGVSTEGMSSSLLPTATATMTTAASTTANTMLSYTTSHTATAFLSSSSRRRTNVVPSSSSTSLNLVNSIPYGGSSTTKPAATTSTVTATSSSNSKSNSNSKKTSLFADATGGLQNGGNKDCPFTKSMAIFGCTWGSFGVVYILAKAIFRVMPIALEPFAKSSAASSLVLSPVQWSMYAACCLFFAYAEGYKGFHLKFAPLVVKRSFTLVIGTPTGNNPINYIFAPLYSMGLFNATKKRLCVSWGVSLGVAMIVALVKKLPPTPRCILDAGVVVGLTIGSASIFYHFIRSILTGKLPDVDACLPAPKPKAAKPKAAAAKQE